MACAVQRNWVNLRATGTKKSGQPGAHHPVVRGSSQAVSEKSVEQAWRECVFRKKGPEVFWLQIISSPDTPEA